MARPLRIQYPDAYYHVTCRGNERRRIFYDDRDHAVFLERLVLSLEIYNVILLVYICMPNHFHLVLTTPEGNLSEFMRHFNISYTSLFNKRHRRVGHLYQGRYKAYLVDADNYLLEVSRYIHLNPVRSKEMSKRPFNEKWKALLKYPWSSLPGYLSVSKRKVFIDYKTILGYMGGDSRKGREEYRRFMRGGIGEEGANPLEVGKGHGIIGGAEFIRWVKEEFLREAKSKRERPALRELEKRYTPEELINRYTSLITMRKKDVCRRGKKSLERAMLMELLYRLCRVTQPEIGKLVGGIDYSAVSRARKRLRRRLENEPQTKKRFDKLNDQLI